MVQFLKTTFALAVSTSATLSGVYADGGGDYYDDDYDYDRDSGKRLQCDFDQQKFSQSFLDFLILVCQHLQQYL